MTGLERRTIGGFPSAVVNLLDIVHHSDNFESIKTKKVATYLYLEMRT